MKHHCSNFTVHNTDLVSYHWEAQNPKAVIIIVHGVGEHALRYQNFVIPHLLSAGFSVFAYDNFGHGKTKGKRGHCPSYDALMASVEQAIIKADSLFPNLPKYLYGHSMGGNLVLNYSIGHYPKLRGVIATSPLLELAFQPPKWKLTLGKAMLKIWPSITLPSELEVDAISRDVDEVKRYEEDAMVHDKVSPMFLFPVIEAGKFLVTWAKWIQIPTLVLHGSSDRITSHKASEVFSSRSSNITFKSFEDAYHELHHDLCKEEFIQTILDWLNGQSNKA